MLYTVQYINIYIVFVHICLYFYLLYSILYYIHVHVDMQRWAMGIQLLFLFRLTLLALFKNGPSRYWRNKKDLL